jgi:hypothetical protein
VGRRWRRDGGDGLLIRAGRFVPCRGGLLLEWGLGVHDGRGNGGVVG